MIKLVQAQTEPCAFPMAKDNEEKITTYNNSNIEKCIVASHTYCHQLKFDDNLADIAKDFIAVSGMRIPSVPEERMMLTLIGNNWLPNVYHSEANDQTLCQAYHETLFNAISEEQFKSLYGGGRFGCAAAYCVGGITPCTHLAACVYISETNAMVKGVYRIKKN